MKKHGKAITISFFVGMFLAGMSLIAYAAELQQQPKLQQQQPTLQQQPKQQQLPKLEKTPRIPLGPPDLFVQSINRQVLNSGQYDTTYNLVITVKNGGGAAGPFDVRVEKRRETCLWPPPVNPSCSFTPSALVTVYNVNGLTYNGIMTYTLPGEYTDSYILPPEANTSGHTEMWNFRITVDSGNAVTESNEGNNMGYKGTIF